MNPRKNQMTSKDFSSIALMLVTLKKGYPFSSFTPYILCLEPPAIWLYVSGSVSIACSSNR